MEISRKWPLRTGVETSGEWPVARILRPNPERLKVFMCIALSVGKICEMPSAEAKRRAAVDVDIGIIEPHETPRRGDASGEPLPPERIVGLIAFVD